MAVPFRYPFQCIQYAGGQSADVPQIIVASAGPKLYSFSAEDGRKLFTWPPAELSRNGDNRHESGNRQDAGTDEPPEKRRKIAASAEDIEKSHEAKVSENNEQKNIPPSEFWSTIPILVASPSGRHIVAVTAEDKSVRVFCIERDGGLTQLSRRPMPKRPNALTLSPDGNTIWSGDKFGDVYSLPLIPSDHPIAPRKTPLPKAVHEPVATTLTVHTKRNLKTLEQQLRHNVAVPERPAVPIAERNMILGHVSLLTDLAYVSLPSGTAASGSRNYLITADRDEHIRVSRGPPQTHIIETYCLGHTSFISKICIPSSVPEFLISAGGDDHLLVWNWRAGEILQKVPLSRATSSTAVAVSGMWEVRLENNDQIAVLIALEGSCELTTYILHPNGEMVAQQPLQLSGNVLDVAYAAGGNLILVCVDGVHESGSTTTWRDMTTENQIFVECFEAKAPDGKLTFEPSAANVVTNINAQGPDEIFQSSDDATRAKERRVLSEALYSFENLRKTTYGGN